MQLSSDFGFPLTYYGAGGKNAKLRKTNGATYRQLLNSGFVGLTSLSLYGNPPERDAPAHDSFAYISVSCLPMTQELRTVISINESFVPFASTKYERIACDLLGLLAWDCGYGFPASAESCPELRLLGAANRKESAQEYASLCAWHAAPADVRKTCMRDVYAYNPLNDAQLAAPAVDGMSLREFAERQPECSLTRATDYGLHLWRVPEASIPRLRVALAGSSALIAPG